MKKSNEKANIRKICTLAKLKAKQNFIKLTHCALGCDNDLGFELKQKEVKEYNKYCFYENLEKALDKVGSR